MKHFIILMLAVLLSSCATQKRCAQKFPPEVSIITETIVKDSIVVRDTTLYVNVPGDTVTIEKEVMVRSPAGNIPVTIDTMSISNDYATAYAWVNNSVMGMRIEPTLKLFELNFKFNERFKLTNTNKSRVEIHQVKYVPKIYRYALGIIIMEIIILLVYLFLRVAIKRYYL